MPDPLPRRRGRRDWLLARLEARDSVGPALGAVARSRRRSDPRPRSGTGETDDDRVRDHGLGGRQPAGVGADETSLTTLLSAAGDVDDGAAGCAVSAK